jgi:hypothetical protein
MAWYKDAKYLTWIMTHTMWIIHPVNGHPLRAFIAAWDAVAKSR